MFGLLFAHKLKETEADFDTQIDRVNAALEIAWRFGQIDGGHHKMWVIDQMVRALLGADFYDEDELEVRYMMEDVETYTEFLESYNTGGYEWEEGIAP